MAYMTGWFDDVCLVLKPYVENVVTILVVNTAHIGRYTNTTAPCVSRRPEFGARALLCRCCC